MHGDLLFWILIALIPIGVPLLILVVMFLVSVVDSAETSPLSGSAKLTCYHCGNETDSGRKTCVHCGGELQ